MGIADFFRPKHRHSDVRVRTEAIKALTKDDAAILEQIARNDRDIGVRRLALGKIDKPSLLADLAADETERSLREFAGERAAELYASTACGSDSEAASAALGGIIKLGDQRALVDVIVRADSAAIRKRAFGELRDPRALQDLARSDAAQDLRVSAVARIDDGDVLRAIAIDTTQKEVGLAAVDKLDDVDRLENVAQKAKNKAVRQRARKIVTEIAEAEKAKIPGVPDEVKRRRAEKAQLVREVEGLADTFDFAKATPQIETAKEAWSKLPADEGDSDERFKKAIERFGKRKVVHDQTARSSDELRVVEREAREARERAAAEKAAAEKAAAEAAATPDPEAEAKRAVREAEAAAKREEQAALRAEEDARRAAQAAEREARRKEDQERSVAMGASLAAMCDDLEQLAAGDGKDGRAIDRVLAQASKAFEQIGKVPGADRDKLADRYQAARGKLVIKASERREAEDWERWANVPKAEALIATAKQMAEEQGTPDLGNRLRGLQALWKEVGPMPQRRSKELWDTFKQSCDLVYEKVRGVRAVENVKFEEVAKLKETLIAEAEALSTSTEWAGTADKLKALQTQWKTSGHLPRKQGDELWKRFRAACDRFFEARKPLLDARRNEETENLAKKHALIARAAAIAEKAPGDGGWGKSIGDIKDLQAQWKEVGYVPRRDADTVYKAFRAACDALFAKRDESRDSEANAHRAEIDAIKAQITDVLTGEGDVVATALAARTKAQEMGVLSTEIDAMMRHVMTAHPDAVKGTELDPTAAKNRRAKLVGKAEELLPKEASAPTGEDLAAKLKNAMRANAFGDLRFSGRDPLEVIDELRVQWRDAGPIFDDEDRAQVAAFEAVVQRVLDAAGARAKQDEAAAPRRRRERRSGEMAVPPTVAVPAAPVIISAHDAITRPVTMPELTADAAPPVPVATAKPVTIAPPMEEVDSGWDLGDDDPTATPSAAEMASDGAPPDSLSDD